MSIDVDINDRTKTPCVNKDQGCKVPNFHICLIGKEDLTEQILAQPPRKRPAYRKPVKGDGTEEARRALISQAMLEHHVLLREKNRDRDLALLKRYRAGGISIRQLSAESGVSRNGIVSILDRAAELEASETN